MASDRLPRITLCFEARTQQKAESRGRTAKERIRRRDKRMMTMMSFCDAAAKSIVGMFCSFITTHSLTVGPLLLLQRFFILHR